MPILERRYGALNCLISTPPCEPPRGAWPILVFLHGKGECAPAPLAHALALHGPLRNGSAPEATRDFIVVAPQLPAPGGDVWVSHTADVNSIPAAIASDYGGDRSRAYLTGFSYGGNGVLRIGSSKAGEWAASWAVEPPGGRAKRDGRPLWLSAGPLSPERKDSIEGSEDRNGSEDLPKLRIFDDPGRDHVGTAVSAYEDGAIYRWRLKHSLPIKASA